MSISLGSMSRSAAARKYGNGSGKGVPLEAGEEGGDPADSALLRISPLSSCGSQSVQALIAIFSWTPPG
jgi:hypothetical protein